jgi:hypothetical protein
VRRNAYGVVGGAGKDGGLAAVDVFVGGQGAKRSWPHATHKRQRSDWINPARSCTTISC